MYYSASGDKYIRNFFFEFATHCYIKLKHFKYFFLFVCLFLCLAIMCLFLVHCVVLEWKGLLTPDNSINIYKSGDYVKNCFPCYITWNILPPIALTKRPVHRAAIPNSTTARQTKHLNYVGSFETNFNSK
jgi:hypothetical protein